MTWAAELTETWSFINSPLKKKFGFAKILQKFRLVYLSEFHQMLASPLIQ